MPAEGKLREAGEEIEIFFEGEWIRLDIADTWLYAPEGATQRSTTSDSRLIFFVPGSGWEDVNGVSALTHEQVADAAALLAAVPDAEQSGADDKSGADDIWGPAVAALVSTAISEASLRGFPDWKPNAEELAELRFFAQTYSQDDAHTAAKNLAIRSTLPEAEAAELESAIAEFQTWSPARRPPTPGELGTIRTHLANKTLTPIQRATMVKNFAQSLGPEAGNIDQQIAADDPFDAQREAIEAESRLESARQATARAQSARSAQEQVDAALDSGDLDKARMIQNFIDEPSEWQVLQLMMQYADNPAAIKVLFDYVDSIGRADVVPDEARQFAEPRAPQRLSDSVRKRLIDPLGWEAEERAKDPASFTELPPGFGTSETSGVGTNKSFLGASEFQDPAAALDRAAGTFRGHVPPEAADATFAERTAGFSQAHTPGAPVPPTSSTSGGLDVSGGMQGTPGATTFSGITPSEGGVVRLIIDGVMTQVHAEFADQVAERAVSEGKTVEGFRGGVPTFLSDPNITSFGGVDFRVTPRFTAEQLSNPLFLQAVSNAFPGSLERPDAPDVSGTFRGFVPPEAADATFAERTAGFSQGYAGDAPSRRVVNVTQEELDRIRAAAGDVRKGLFSRGQVRYVNPTTGDVQISSYTTQADIDAFLSQRPEFVELDRTEAPNAADPVLDSLGRVIKQPGYEPSRVVTPEETRSKAERFEQFKQTAGAFAPKKKTPSPFGTPRLVTT